MVKNPQALVGILSALNLLKKQVTVDAGGVPSYYVNLKTIFSQYVI